MTEELVVILGVSAALWLMMRAVRSVPRVEGTVSVLDYRRPFKVFAVCCWLLVALMIAVAISDPQQRTLGIVLALVFGAMTLYLQLEFFKVRIVVDSAGIRTFSPWCPPRVIPWESVTGVTYSRLAQWHVIHTDRLGSVRLPLYLSGVPALLGELERRGFTIPTRAA